MACAQRLQVKDQRLEQNSPESRALTQRSVHGRHDEPQLHGGPAAVPVQRSAVAIHGRPAGFRPPAVRLLG